MSEDVIAFDSYSARRIDDTVTRVLGSESSPGTTPQPYGGRQAIIVEPVDVLRELLWATSTFDVTIHSIDGDIWRDDATAKVAEPVRLVTNGLQVAIPVAGSGLCVRDDAFWAVNIGSLAAATHPLTGHASGIAGVLQVNEDGDLEITDGRLPFIRRDGSEVIADGTLIQLSWVSGSLTIAWADCAPHEALEGLEAAP